MMSADSCIALAATSLGVFKPRADASQAAIGSVDGSATTLDAEFAMDNVMETYCMSPPTAESASAMSS